jgi:hypothetical protein
MGFEDEVEQSVPRPCRQTNGRFKRKCELTSSIVPRGTPFHRSVELEFPPIGCDPARFSCCCCGLFPGPAELGAVKPNAVHDHGQPTRQRHDRLFHPAAPGDLHRPTRHPSGSSGPLLARRSQAVCGGPRVTACRSADSGCREPVRRFWNETRLKDSTKTLAEQHFSESCSHILR